MPRIIFIFIAVVLGVHSASHAADFLGANVEDREVSTAAWRTGVKGVRPIVTDVPNGTLASQVGLHQGDVIIKVGESLAGSAQYLVNLTKSANDLTVLRGMERITLSLGATLSTSQPINNLQAKAKSSEPPTAPILRIETGRHNASIKQIDVDRSGRWLVSVSDDKTVRVWDTKSGIEPYRILRPPIGEGNDGKLYSVAISPDGELVAVGGYIEIGGGFSVMLYLFSRADGHLLGAGEGLPHVIQRLTFSPDGKWLVATLANKNGVRIFAVDGVGAGLITAPTLRLIAQDSDYGGESYAAHFSAEGSRLVTSCHDGYLRVYDVASVRAGLVPAQIAARAAQTEWLQDPPLQLKPIAKQKAPGGEHPISVEFSPDGTKVAVAFDDTARVNVLSAKDLTLLYTPDSRDVIGSLSSIAWSRDGHTLFAGGNHADKQNRKYIRRWNGAGRGSFADLKSGSTSTIFDLVALPDGGMAFGAADPAIGIVGGSAGVVDLSPLLGSVLADYRGVFLENGFGVSSDGASVQYSYDMFNKSPAIFSLSTRVLSPIQNSKLNIQNLSLSDTTSLIINNWQNKRTPTINNLPLKLDQYETSRSLAIAPDKRSFLLGTEWYLRRFDSGGNEQWNVPVPVTAWAVNIAKNGKVTIAAFGDGTIRWYNYATGRELVAFFPHSDKKRWVLWTPEGFFDHSPGGEELIGWHLNQGKDKEALFFPASKLYKEFYRPDLVTASFEGKDLSAYAKAIDINKILSRETIPPTVHFLTKSGSADNYDTQIRAQVCDTGGGIGDVTLFLNDMPVAVETAGRGLKAVEKNRDGQCYSFERTITLSPGANSIQLMAYNKANTIESHRDTIEINHTAKAAQPELHVLTVAINAYRDGDLRLKYALPDADALTEQLQSKGKGLFNKVHLHTLRDGDVTKEGLAQKFSSIGTKMKREDVFLLFVAGHGITDEKEGAYYFLPADFRYTGEGEVQKQGVSMTDFRNMLANVQAMKSLILLDTCNSGSFAEAIASRGIIEKTAITKLSRAVGRATIVASSKSQVALEGYEGHGAFTWTLLEGMKGKAADQGGKITINTLATFIEEELPKLTFKKWGYEQIPQKTLQGMDFQIGLK